MILVRIILIMLIGLLLGAYIGILQGCIAYIPKTNEEWAYECLSQKTPEEFRACVDRWDSWAVSRVDRED